MKPPTDKIDSELAELLRSPAVWQPTTPPRPPERVREMASLADRCAAEDAAAAELLDSLANTPGAWWRMAVMKSPVGRTAGVVRQLLERWRTERYKSPARALELTALAVDIANEISLTEYPCDFVISMRADAWRDHAFVLQLLGRFPEAVAAVNEAERLLRETALPDYGLARIKLVRANILAWD